jgi:sortase B
MKHTHLSKSEQHFKIRTVISVILLLLVAGVCLGLLFFSVQYSLPAKTAVPSVTDDTPLLDRSAYAIQETLPIVDEEGAEEDIDYEMQLDMENMLSYHEVNPDVVGWIYIQDTVINYPIMQGTDNNFYIDHNWMGQYSSSGSIFADWRCNLDSTDNTLIYGHNMGNGSMFHAIKNYKDAEWGNAHPYIEAASLGHRYLYRVLSVNVIYGEEGASFVYWNCVNMNRTEYREFYENIQRTATVWYGDDMVAPRDGVNRILTLQTCNSGADDGIRCVVFAQCLGEY